MLHPARSQPSPGLDTLHFSVRIAAAAAMLGAPSAPELLELGGAGLLVDVHWPPRC